MWIKRGKRGLAFSWTVGKERNNRTGGEQSKILNFIFFIIYGIGLRCI